MAKRVRDESRRWMNQALRLAERGIGMVEPNPRVGCVLVRQGRIIGRGYHKRFGAAHAEIEALADCRRQGESPVDADVYVTLEPCCHQGKTGPCTQALIEARVKRVVAAMIDPFEQVAGQGVAKLREAGIAVEVGLGEEQARELNEPFVKRVTTGLPWVMVKWAQSVDGKIASGSGQSKWISSEASRGMVHELRARVDAIMVGIGTAQADDPALTARDVPIRRTARRVVVDANLELPRPCQLMNTLASAPLTLAVSERVSQSGALRTAETSAQARWTLMELKDRGVEVLPLPVHALHATHLDLKPLLQHLATRHQASTVLVEGGGRLIGSLFQQGLVDQVWAFVAGKIIGDGRAPASVSGMQTTRMCDAPSLILRHVHRVGGDVLLDYRVAKGS